MNTQKGLSGLETFDFIVFVLYIVARLAIVYRASRHQHNTDDFFLGNRRLPWMAVGLSIMATLLSSLTYLGLTGDEVLSYQAPHAGIMRLSNNTESYFGD